MSSTERDTVNETNDSLSPGICYRDPADVRTIPRQSLLIILALVIAAIAVVGVFPSRSKSQIESWSISHLVGREIQ